MVAALVLVLLLAACVPGGVREGEKLYLRHCASCHGPSARGTEIAPPIHPNSRKEVAERVRQHPNPALSPEALADAQLRQIGEFLLYLHSTSHPH